eukprot:1664019-Amphidinium_carterae.1
MTTLAGMGSVEELSRRSETSPHAKMATGDIFVPPPPLASSWKYKHFIGFWALSLGGHTLDTDVQTLCSQCLLQY